MMSMFESLLTDDQVKQLTDFSLESETLGGHFWYY